MKWVVEMFYRGRIESREFFSDRASAMAHYETKLGACRFGLVGWSVGYPKEVA